MKTKLWPGSLLSGTADVPILPRKTYHSSRLRAEKRVVSRHSVDLPRNCKKSGALSKSHRRRSSDSSSSGSYSSSKGKRQPHNNEVLIPSTPVRKRCINPLERKSSSAYGKEVHHGEEDVGSGRHDPRESNLEGTRGLGLKKTLEAEKLRAGEADARHQRQSPVETPATPPVPISAFPGDQINWPLVPVDLGSEEIRVGPGGGLRAPVTNLERQLMQMLTRLGMYVERLDAVSAPEVAGFFPLGLPLQEEEEVIRGTSAPLVKPEGTSPY